MQKFYNFILSVLLLMAAPAHAKNDDNVVGVNGEFGMNGNYGLFGVELAAFPSQRFGLHGGLGIGATAMGGGGFRIYMKDRECFFFKRCSEREFFGVTYSNTLSSEVIVTNESGEREYRIPKTSFVNLTFGLASVYFGVVNTMVHLGYKLALNETEAELVQGEEDRDSKKDLDEQLKSGPQVSISLGLAI